jgi:hypothetical protein
MAEKRAGEYKSFQSDGGFLFFITTLVFGYVQNLIAQDVRSGHSSSRKLDRSQLMSSSLLVQQLETLHFILAHLYPKCQKTHPRSAACIFDFLFSFPNRSVEPAMSSVLPSPPKITIGHSVSLLYMLSKNLNFSACVSLFLAPSKTRTKKVG